MVKGSLGKKLQCWSLKERLPKKWVLMKRIQLWSWKKEMNLRCHHHMLVIECENAQDKNLQWKMEKEKYSHEREHHVRQKFYQLRGHKLGILFDRMDIRGRDNVWLEHQTLWGDGGVLRRNTSIQKLANGNRWAVCGIASQRWFLWRISVGVRLMR